MAQVVHHLWKSDDPSIMLMPGSVPIRSSRVEPELLRYLNHAWQGIIAGDVDGQDSIPSSIDQSVPNLNRYKAARRVARAIFVATAATEGQQNPGIDDKRVYLAVAQPGEKIAIFSDALCRLTDRAKFMHRESGRCWYTMTPNLNRIAIDRAGQFEEDLVLQKIDQALSASMKGIDRGNFAAVQVAPGHSADVPDEPGGVRAVILGVAHPHQQRTSDSPARIEAKNILEQRGNAPRVYRNTLIFLAADYRNLETLKEGLRLSLAWEGIVDDSENGRMDLRTSDITLAKKKKKETQGTFENRLKETWCHLITPSQESPHADVELSCSRISPQDGCLDSASKKLVNDDALILKLGPDNLNLKLKKYVWADKPHLSLKDVWEYLNRCIYLPRLRNRETLIKTIQAAIGSLIAGPFAYAERWNPQTESYEGLVIGGNPHGSVVIDSESLLVRPEIAEANRPAPTAVSQQMSPMHPAATASRGDHQPGSVAVPTAPTGSPVEAKPAVEKKPTRFIGTVMLSADRPARDMKKIVEEIVEQLTTLPGADVSLKLEIDAEVATGLNQAKVRTLMENAATLGFIDKSVGWTSGNGSDS